MYQVVLCETAGLSTNNGWRSGWAATRRWPLTRSRHLATPECHRAPLTYAAPPYDAIIEELFPAEAMTDPMVFYMRWAIGEAKRHRETMVTAVVRFIDFDKMDRIPIERVHMKS